MGIRAGDKTRKTSWVAKSQRALDTMINGFSYWEIVKDMKQEGHKKTCTLERSF